MWNKEEEESVGRSKGGGGEGEPRGQPGTKDNV